MNNWIETKEKMPSETDGVIMWVLNGGVGEPTWIQGYFYGGEFYKTGSNKPFKKGEVTHWFIPEPPKP